MVPPVSGLRHKARAPHVRVRYLERVQERGPQAHVLDGYGAQA